MLSLVNIKIKIEQDFEILYDVNGHWLDISLSSGYQKFILNLVFRIVIWQFADVVIPDAIIIDEGFGMCDSENISIITDMIKSLVNNDEMPKLIFIVSHVDTLVKNIESPLFIENGKIITHQSVQFNENMLDSLINENNEYVYTDNNLTENSEIINILNDNVQIDDNLSNNVELSTFNDKFYCERCNVYIKLNCKNKHLISQKHKKNI